MYQLILKNGEKKYSICVSSDKEMIDDLAENLNKYFDNHYKVNQGILLRDFLADESEQYYLIKVMDYYAPGFGAMIILESLKRLSKKKRIVVKDNMFDSKRTFRRRKYYF